MNARHESKVDQVMRRRFSSRHCPPLQSPLRRSDSRGHGRRRARGVLSVSVRGIDALTVSSTPGRSPPPGSIRSQSASAGSDSCSARARARTLACATCDRPISPPLRHGYELFDMFCAFGATARRVAQPGATGRDHPALSNVRGCAADKQATGAHRRRSSHQPHQMRTTDDGRNRAQAHRREPRGRARVHRTMPAGHRQEERTRHHDAVIATDA